MLSIEKQIELLLKGRVDLVIGVGKTFEHTLVQMGLQDKIDKVEFGYLRQISAYMALSRKSRFAAKSDEFTNTVKLLQKNGKLNEILVEYGIYERKN